MLAPLAPHVAEELWHELGNTQSVVWQPFPTAEQDLLVDDEVELPVQVNGKVRDRLRVAAGTGDEELLALALASERVQAHVDGKELRKTVVVPGKLVSLVV